MTTTTLEAPTPGLLSTPPEYLEWFAHHGDIEGETVVGFFAETVPDGPGRVRPDLWVLVTTGGLYYLDPRRRQCVRARSLHPLDVLEDREPVPEGAPSA